MIKADAGTMSQRLIACPDCGHTVSVRAGACPHCGLDAPGEVLFADQAAAAERVKRRIKLRATLETALISCGTLALAAWIGSMLPDSERPKSGIAFLVTVPIVWVWRYLVARSRERRADGRS